MLIWALGMIEDISNPLCRYDKNLKFIKLLFEESNNLNDFKSKCKLRSQNEVLDMFDLYYRYYWACYQKALRPEVSIGDLNPESVMERKRGLEWLISPEDDWYDIPMEI